MRLLVIVLSVVILVGFVGGAEAKKKRRQTIVIRDYTSAAWDGTVVQVVADFNAVMPRGVRLSYERGRGACEGTSDSVAVCTDPNVLNSTGDSIWNGKRTRLLWSVVTMTDQERGLRAEDRRHWLCHELMHALTGVPDNHGALPDQSCVWGHLSAPGPFDVEWLHRRY